jgi:PRTRC genetic system protein E
MKTNFFENIASLHVPGNWKIAIHTDDKGQFTISALFGTNNNGDNAYKVVPPMLLKGTAQELDEGFFEAITQPVQETAGLFRNMEEYLKGLEQAKKLSKMEQDKKAQGNKATTQGKPADDGEAENEDAEPVISKEEMKKAYDGTMKRIGELNDACKYQEALDLLPAVEDYPDKKAELEKKHADLTRKAKQYATMLQLF